MFGDLSAIARLEENHYENHWRSIDYQDGWNAFIFMSDSKFTTSSVLKDLTNLEILRIYNAWENADDGFPEIKGNPYLTRCARECLDIRNASKEEETSEQWWEGNLYGATLGAAVQQYATIVANQIIASIGAKPGGITKGTLTGSLNGLTPAERTMVNDLLNQGKNVEIIPRSNTQGIKTADFKVNGVLTELKTLNGTSLNTPVTRIQDGFKQGASSKIARLCFTKYKRKR